MKYIEVSFNSNPASEDIYDAISASIATIGFESFVQSDNLLLAYIDSTQFSTNAIDDFISNFPLDVNISYTFKEIEDKNWNEEWEKHFFEPIVFENKCIIHSSFHNVTSDYEYKILIDPKMAFGTGHHQTTSLMIKNILGSDFRNKTVLDMGCGTAVLAILASMRGAKNITAIDIDKWAYENAIENVKLNSIENINIQLGGAELLGNEKFDIILANINRNILLEDIPHYVNVLNDGGTLIVSGFYEEDIPMISNKCIENKLSFKNYFEQDNWVAVVYNK